MNEKIMSIEKAVEGVPDMKIKLDILWRAYLIKSDAYIGLSEKERDILRRSNIEIFTEQHYEEILSSVRAFKPDNAREAEELLISVVNQYKGCDDCRDAIQQAVRSSGYDTDSLLLLTALSIRDRVVADLGFKPRK